MPNWKTIFRNLVRRPVKKAPWLAVVLALALPFGALALAYTVQPGDALWQIARKYSVSVADLKSANGLTSDLIYPGQTLQIPGQTPAPAPGGAETTYRVQAGNTLWQVGQRFSLSVSDLKTANRLTSDALYVGQALVLPDPTPAPAPGQPDFRPLRKQMMDYLVTQPATYKVYFQDLTSGASFGIGSDNWMVAASCTKLPTVLYLYTQAAAGRINLDEKFAYQASDFQYGAGVLQYSAQPGTKYSLRSLAHLAITLSDNVAHRMLLRRLGQTNVAAFMKQLGGETVYPNGQNVTTANDLAAYLRAVLDFQKQNPGLGGQLVADLQNTIWNAGLNGDLPDDVPVAHKEGDVTGVSNDYGVVFSNRPYLLVVLSKEQASADAGFAYIAHLSRLAFDYENTLAGNGN